MKQENRRRTLTGLVLMRSYSAAFSKAMAWMTDFDPSPWTALAQVFIAEEVLPVTINK
jgi:hypothetical protein